MLSTQSLLLLATGVTLYSGVFHGAYARHLPANRWLAGWALAASGFLAARLAQLVTTDPHQAAFAARIYMSLAPLMVWLILSFVFELTGERVSRTARRYLIAAVLAMVGLSLLTSWVIADDATWRLDFFGVPFLSPNGRAGLGLIALATFGALGWSLAALRRASQLAASERRGMSVALSVYAAMAAESLLSSVGLVPFPGVVEFAPLAFVLATSHLSANRERRLERDLESAIDGQAAKLRASEERYRNLVEHAPLGVVVCDQRGNVLTMTERFRSILGISEATGTVPRNLLDDAPPGARGEMRLFARALTTGKSASGELPYMTRAGRRVDLRVVVAPQATPEGTPDGALILAEDVTERRAAEARLRQSLKLEAIGQLAGGIANGVTLPMAEVRENLGAIERGFDELRESLPAAERHAARFAEIEDLLAESREGVERAIAIVRDMRDLSHGNSLTREPVELNELLAGVVRMAATQRRGTTQINEHYAALPRVIGNAGQLRQVFLNLVVNAIQAVGESGRVDVETVAENGGVCVRVRDDGPGISEEHREKMFVPFFTTKAAGEGTGLGLYISYHIVQGHGGEIRIGAEPGAGATFSVWLPGSPAIGAAA